MSIDQQTAPPGARIGDEVDGRRLRDLLVRVGRGDQHAFALIYELTSAQVFVAMRARFDDEHQCEAAMVRGYRMVWTAAPRFDGARHDPVCWTLELALLGALPLRGTRPRPQSY